MFQSLREEKRSARILVGSVAVLVVGLIVWKVTSRKRNPRLLELQDERDRVKKSSAEIIASIDAKLESLRNQRKETDTPQVRVALKDVEMLRKSTLAQEQDALDELDEEIARIK